jgi:hypothetical protein
MITTADEDWSLGNGHPQFLTDELETGALAPSKTMCG